MTDIQIFKVPKYENMPKYTQIEDGIYECKQDSQISYVMSLSFVQEPRRGEGENASEISQYPLETILDRYHCSISDFYEDWNLPSSKTCYLEFEAMRLLDIMLLSNIVGRRVYRKRFVINGKTTFELIVESLDKRKRK